MKDEFPPIVKKEGEPPPELPGYLVAPKGDTRTTVDGYEYETIVARGKTPEAAWTGFIEQVYVCVARSLRGKNHPPACHWRIFPELQEGAGRNDEKFQVRARLLIW